ncbi:alpha/beta hydrolase [Nocardioides agariphilus]|uniref:Alpha/beta hydrolase n=1 Tax=Nocardioides agariphilus TaxID=433664 RepID=A0A930YK61_9ACTN|nr:alpha/beta hydrolase [Nocardioides agariphilus]MBF4769903.1 alpha/beta hydrolase [Nocardioides agariphilus]
MRIRQKARVAVALALLAVGTGCSSDPGEPASGPTYERVACPDDVEVLVVPEHECGFVRPDRDGSLQIFVVSVEPPEPSDLSPVLETGVDLGMTPSYGGLAPIAQRTGRRVVIVDLPGTGHSLPSLDCPGVDGLGDAAAESAVIAAVEECRRQVESAGIDPLMVTPERLGEALYAVTRALDVPHWVVMGHGTTAEAGRQLALAHPGRVEALVLDSVVVDPAARTRDVVASIAGSCREDRRCRRTYGDLTETWQRASQQLAREPISVDIPGTTTTISIDAANLDRAIRWLVAPAATGPGLLPALLAEAAAGRPGPQLQLFADTLSVAPPLCVGYVPKCETQQRLVIGSTLSAMCPTMAETAAWSAACNAWGVSAAPADLKPLTGVPTLALFGTHDPFASPSAIRERLAALAPDAFVVEQASGAHNVLGSECPRLVRNEWLATAVRDPPPELACLADPIDFQP